jgi:hypothetical protein
MTTTTVRRIHDLLDAALRATDDDEVRFRLRTAIQLLEVVEENHGRANEVLADLDLETETRERLAELGYLE